MSNATLAAGTRVTLVSAVTDLGLTLIKAVLGVMSGSQALIADALHSLSDLMTDGITYAAIKLGHAEADDTHPYGHGKFETFGTLILAVLLTLTGLIILWEAAQVLWHGTAPEVKPIALLAAGLGVIAKEALFRYCLWEGARVKSNILTATGWHHRADGLSSLAALIGIGLSVAGYPMCDPLAAALVGVYLMYTSYGLGRDAFDELVDAAVPDDTRREVEHIIVSTPGVQAMHLLRARHLGGKILLDVHVEVDPMISVSEGHLIAETIHHRLKTALSSVSDATVHIDPADLGPLSLDHPTRPDLEVLVAREVQALAPELSVVDVVLHFLDQRRLADIIIAAESLEALKARKPDLERALTLPNGPFTAVTFALKV
jgi:cation diffusion facilitator family transporter